MKIFQKFFSLAGITILLFGCTHQQEQTAVYNIIPKPLRVDASSPNFFVMNSDTRIYYTPGNDSLLNNAIYLKERIKDLTGLDLKISKEEEKGNVIELKTDSTLPNPEGYELQVEKERITIEGGSPAGNFYGLQTLIKSIPEAKQGNVIFPGVNISDSPRFAYRGAHFDVARHFFPKDSVKTFIDMLAMHNINTFHWHLTDDQGWRIEINKRPLLTEKGSKRNGTVIGHNSGEYDSIPVAGFYTQEEIKEIVDYAGKRYIKVIPEIDLPGHMQAALNSYPELGCFNDKYDVWEQWGVSENVLCAGKEETYKFLEEVLSEVADLFPGDLIHIGGDECPKEHWVECELCQMKIKELGLVSDKIGTKEDKLQSHIMKYASDFLKSKGKRVIGWDEILDGGIEGDIIIMSWRGEEGGYKAAKLGHDAIMVPTSYLYFDYYQTLDKDKEPDAIGGYVPIEKVYSYEPIPEGLTDEEARHILGLQANLWTEYISEFSHAQYMELPRMAALSEVQWSQSPKDYNNFVARLPQLINHYKANGYKYSTHVYDITGASSSDREKKKLYYTLSVAGEHPIYYTVDGSEPSKNSPVYKSPIQTDSKTVIKAKHFIDGENSETFTDSVTVNKATWKQIKLLTPPNSGYSDGAPEILVDGCFGPNAVTKGSWLGFNSENIVAVLDLGEQEKISSLNVRALVVTGSWIFNPRKIQVDVSQNGESWKQVASQEYPPLDKDLNKILSYKLDFMPTDAKYVRLTLKTEDSMPAWHPAAGEQGFVFIDEIEVE